MIRCSLLRVFLGTAVTVGCRDARPPIDNNPPRVVASDDMQRRAELRTGSSLTMPDAAAEISELRVELDRESLVDFVRVSFRTTRHAAIEADTKVWVEALCERDGEIEVGTTAARVDQDGYREDNFLHAWPAGNAQRATANLAFLGIDEPLGRCSLRFAMGSRNQVSEPYLGTACWEGNVLKPAECSPPLTAPISTSSDPIEIAGVDVSARRFGGSTLGVRIKSHYPRERGETFSVKLACPTGSQTLVDEVSGTGFGPGMHGPFGFHAGHVYGIQADLRRSELNVGSRPCDLTVAVTARLGGTRYWTSPVAHNCVRGGRGEDGPCVFGSSVSPTDGVPLSPASATITSRLTFEPETEYLPGVTASLEVEVTANAKLDVQRLPQMKLVCTNGESAETIEPSMYGLHLLQVLGAGETARMSSSYMQLRMRTLPEQCELQFTLSAAVRGAPPVVLHTACFRNGVTTSRPC
ncbi:MAG: hypothetical protein JKY37_13140 [Nannocystaceae bacterium]|nr:hypothetical protein [Nannocystaceae bacterium]